MEGVARKWSFRATSQLHQWEIWGIIQALGRKWQINK